MNLRSLFTGSTKDSEQDGRRISGDPMVIANADGEILSASRTRIEVTEDSTGRLRLVSTAEDGTSHTLEEAEIFLAPETMQKQLMLSYDRLQYGNRGGDAYLGINAQGEPETWYLGSAADAYILSKGQRPEANR